MGKHLLHQAQAFLLVSRGVQRWFVFYIGRIHQSRGGGSTLQYLLQSNVYSIYVYLQFRTTATNCKQIIGREIGWLFSASDRAWVEKQCEALAVIPLGSLSQRSWRKSVWKPLWDHQCRLWSRMLSIAFVSLTCLLHAVAAFTALLWEDRKKKCSSGCLSFYPLLGLMDCGASWYWWLFSGL